MVRDSISWDRYWYPAGTVLPDGYLSPPEHDSSDRLGVRLTQLDDIPCLILLGVPGMGKTREMKRASKLALERGEQSIFVSLRNMNSTSDLSAFLIDDMNGHKTCNVFLDGLDEALSHLIHIEQLITNFLRDFAAKTGGLDRLRLRISCRSAEWPLALEAELRALWGDGGVKLFELGNLQKTDVEAAAATLPEAETSRFVKLIEDYDAESLASRPITLNMLLNVFEQNHDFPRERVQLYRRGLLASIEETNTFRRSSRQTGRLDIRSKLMVAGRIAAATIFSNSSQIWLGLHSEKQPHRSVTLSEIAGGLEPTMGFSFPVGETELYEVLYTSLFLPTSGDTFVWSHQTFSEFLAAYYLVEHALSPDEMLDFLRSSSANRTIAPQLYEVAAWIASMVPEFFRALADLEPSILLRSDVSSAAPRDREILVRELLIRFENGEIHDFDYSIRSRYSRLHHPALASQLIPYILDKNKDIVVRRVAIDVAEETNLDETISVLEVIAGDPSDNLHIRSQATAALTKIGTDASRNILRSLALEPNQLDVDDELKGWALRGVWPNFITLSELLRSLTPPKNDNLIGAYWMFLSLAEFAAFSERDALAALSWLQGLPKDEEYNRSFENLILRLLTRIWERADTKSVVDKLALFLIQENRLGRAFDTNQKLLDAFDIPNASIEKRKALIFAIIRNAVDSTGGDLLYLVALQRPIPLLTKNDLSWLLEELLLKEPKVSVQILCDLIVNLSYSGSLDELTFVWDGAELSPILKAGLEQAYSVKLDSAVAKWQRDDLARKARRVPAETGEEISARIEQSLTEIENGNGFRWWEFNLVLLSRADGHWEGAGEFSSDITKARNWDFLNPNLQRRIVVAAFRYLTEHRIRSSQWLGTNTFHRPAAAGYRAFVLLYLQAPELYRSLSEATWSKWTSSILGLSFNDDNREIRNALARRCFEYAPQQIRRVIKRLLAKSKSEFDVREALRTIEEIGDDKLDDYFWELYQNLEADDVRRKPIVSFLASRAFAPAVQFVLEFLQDRGRPKGTSLEGEIASACAALLQSETRAFWKPFVDAWNAKPELARRILEEISQREFLSNQPFYFFLSESELADLFIWSYKNIPPSEEERGRARTLRAADHVDQLRGGMLAHLVGRGTPASLSEVARISAELPEAKWLKWKIVDAKSELNSKSWKSFSATEVIALIASFRKAPPIRDTVSAIKAAQADLLEAADIELDEPLSVSNQISENIELKDEKSKVAASIMEPKRILLVASEWSSGHGGISTLNRELCTALASAGHFVVCLVVDPTQRERDEAEQLGVKLIGALPDPTIEAEDRLILISKREFDDFVPEIVIGHDHVTGSAGFHIARRVFVTPSYVHFVHTLPEEIEPYKSRRGSSYLRGARKAAAQIQHCQRADLVVCIGPRIHREIQTKLAGISSVSVVECRPGLDRKLLAHKIDLSKRRSLSCLFLGRLEDSDLKGAELACASIVALNGSWRTIPRPKLIMRGFNTDDDIYKMPGFAAAKPYLSARPFTSDSTEIASDICSASVIIMPSKSEGFGLVALEGIAAGIPIVVTPESGIAELLMDTSIVSALGQSRAEACIREVNGTDACDQWAGRLNSIFSEPAGSFSEANHIREALKGVLTWENCADQLMSDVDTILAGARKA
jgi:glycosyltransferase involved in cell wall biosynthesis